MSAAGFQGRGPVPRGGRNIRGATGGVVTRFPQPNFNQPRRDGHGIPNTEYWLENSPPVPWQQMNGIPPQPQQQFSNYESHRYRGGAGGGGRPQLYFAFGPRGRSRRIRGEGRARPGILPNSGYSGIGSIRPETDSLRLPPLGSEEERQQKIAETADKLKQKLSTLDIVEPVNFWEDDLVGVSFSNDEEEHGVASKGIPELRHDPPELNLTINDFRDIGRVDPDNCVNPVESAEVLPLEKTLLKVHGETDEKDPKVWPKSVQRKHTNDQNEISEPLNNNAIIENIDTEVGTSTGNKQTPNPSADGSEGIEADQATKGDQNSLISQEKYYSRVEKAALKITEKKKNSDLKPELTKSLEKLREVIKVDRELEKEGKSAVHNEARTTFQGNSQPRLQPDVRLDFHPGIAQGYQRYQDFGNSESREIRNRFRGSFGSEHPRMDMQPQNFAPDYQQRFDLGQRNFNIHQRQLGGPRPMPPEFGGPMSSRIQNRNPDLQMGYDNRDLLPRFNAPQHNDLFPNNQAWYNRNDVPYKYGLANNINELQTPPAFNPRGPPPIYTNQDQERNVFAPHIGPPSDFPPVVPLGYPQVPHTQMRHPAMYFNPSIPHHSTAPCIINEFPLHSTPLSSSSMENKPSLQPPPIPTVALNVQPNVLQPPPQPPSDDIQPQLSVSENPTPNMDDELEDMQEALEFAKKLMNMTDEEHEAAQAFSIPTFPDLPPIPSTELSHLVVEMPIQQSVIPDRQIDGVQNDLLQDQMLSEVSFDPNTKTKIMTQIHQESHDDSSSKVKISKTFPMSEFRSEKQCDAELRENRKHKKNKPHKERDNAKISELKDCNLAVNNLNEQASHLGNVTEITNKISNDNLKGRPSSSKTSGKTLPASVADANWKDKVINQFLRMSKNEICDMVNSSGLRKFDIAMKHLVKERKYSLSQERRSSADEAVKGYDMSREEFMNQLSAMLDPSATVDVKNLPSKFIQHLSEVLKLDVESHLNDNADQVGVNDMFNSTDSIENFVQEDVNTFFHISESQNFSPDSLGNAHENFGRNFTMEVSDIAIDRPTQYIPMSANISYVSTSMDNANNSLGETLPNSNTADNIFSERIENAQKTVDRNDPRDEKNRIIEEENISHGLIRAKCTKTLMSEEHIALEDLFSSGIASPKEAVLKNSDNEREVSLSEGKFEPGERWERRTSQDHVDMFRNLTKEEWEARCVSSIDSSNDKDFRTRSRTPSSRDTLFSTRSQSPRQYTDKVFKRHASRNISPPSPLAEKNYNSNIVVHSKTDAADNWRRAIEDESFRESNSNNHSDCSSTSSDSDRSTSSNVAKLLKVIKEREKIAKDMSLSETMRDEIAAEIESAKNKERENQADRKYRRREKMRKRIKRRERKRLQRAKRIGFETDDNTRIAATDETMKHEIFIKQELIIEADDEPSFETNNDPPIIDESKKSDSHSIIDINKEMLPEVPLQGDNEVHPSSASGTNIQGMLIAQEYATRSTISEVSNESLHNLTNLDDENSVSNDAETGISMPAENCLENFKSNETRVTSSTPAETQLSKAGTKKIDIKAYKARKIKRNTQKHDKSKRIEACSSQQIKKEDIPKDVRSDRNTEESKQQNPIPDIESDLKKKLPVESQDSLTPVPRKEKSSVPKEKYDKRSDRKGDRKSSKERIASKYYKSDDKKRSRTLSSDRKRSRSREDRHRTWRAKSKHSSRERHHDGVRSDSLDKLRGRATHQNNNIVESKDEKTKSHKTDDSKMKSHERIEKRHSSGSRKIIAEEKQPKDKETKKQTHRREDSHKSIADKIITCDKNATVDHFNSHMETTEVEEKNKEISRAAKVLIDDSETISLELDKSEKSCEVYSHDSVPEDNIIPSAGLIEDTCLKSNDEPIPQLTCETNQPENEFHVSKSEQDADKEPGNKENNSIQNESEDSSHINEEILKSNILKDKETETSTTLYLPDSTEDILSDKAEKTLEVTSELELEQSHQNDIKSILNDLIDKAISQLDLLSNKNEAKKSVVVRIEETKQLEICRKNDVSLEIESSNKNENKILESTEHNIKELNSPESPLKGFSEDCVETSVLGRQKLDQSVLEITQDYMLQKKSEDLDNSLLNRTPKDTNVAVDYMNRVPDQVLEEIKSDPTKMKIEILESVGDNVSREKSELKQDYEKDEVSATCVTPSGDTLSLGSSIDFDNGEFIVLSEISSDENFSQDENHKPEVKVTSNNHELVKVKSQKHDDIKVNPLCADKTQKKREAVNSKLKMEMKKSAKSSEIQGNSGKTSDSLNKNPAANQSTEFQKETTMRDNTEEAYSLRKLVENAKSHEELNIELISQKSSVIIEDQNCRKKFSESKKSCEIKNLGNSSSKNISSRENIADKNLHGVQHKHKMKHKKEKRNKSSEKQIKEAVKEEELVTVVKKSQTKESVMARMVEIDLEIHKLMSEKMKLYKMLESGVLLNEQSLVIGKEEHETLHETTNSSRREPDPCSLSNNETHASTVKQKASGSKNSTEVLQSKSSKITTGATSEDDTGNRHSGSQKETSISKSKKSHKNERRPRHDESVQIESRKSSADRTVDTKSSSNSRRKHTEDKSSSKKYRHSDRSSSSSSRRKEEEQTSRRNTGSEKEALDNDGITQKSKKGDSNSGQKKKLNRIPVLKDDLRIHIKKESQSSAVKDEIKPRSRTASETVNVTQEKHPHQVYSNENNQVSALQECKGNKKELKGLALLEETYKRDRSISRKSKAAISKGKKSDGLKCSQKSSNAKLLSPSEEETPLNLRFKKNSQKKNDQHNIGRLKRTHSTEILDHVLETINAVAENKTQQYRGSKKIKSESEETRAHERNISRKSKVTSQRLQRMNYLFDSYQDASGSKIIEDSSDDDYGELDNFDVPEDFISPDNEFLKDNIVEISKLNDGAGNVRNKPRIKNMNSMKNLVAVSLLENTCRREMDETVKELPGKLRNDDPSRSNLPGMHMLNCMNDIPPFNALDSSFMPQELTSQGASISRNINDIEKGLDVLDSMLETVGSGMEGTFSKHIANSNFVSKNRKQRKRKGSSYDCDSQPCNKKRNTLMTRAEMMNCSVILVDCKYMCNVNMQERSSPQPQLKIKLEMPDLPESDIPGEESPDWLLSKDQLIDGDENLCPINGENYFNLNHMEINSVYGNEDLEIMKLNASTINPDENLTEIFSHEATIPEIVNWQSLDELKTADLVSSECSVEQAMDPLDIEELNFSNCPMTEILEPEQLGENTVCANPASPKLMDIELHTLEANIEETNHAKDQILETEISSVSDEKTAPESRDNDQTIDENLNKEDTEIQEVELPRIQYSVHKGPILDVKVFGDSILAASEDGVIYRYSQTCNGILNTYEGHKSAVTCMYVLQETTSTGTTNDLLFSGSLDGSLRCFDIMTSQQVRGAADIGSPIQCMDQSWGVIFLGTKSGYVFRFHIKMHAFKGDEIKFSEESVLALKATTEGPRRVLIVASRSQPITIRDAQNGLFLRTVSGHKSHTVYSLMMDSNLVYCGTSSTAIPVFDFINGSQVSLYNAGPGIVCMRIYKWLLFAGCYDGNIYVFDTKEQRLVCSIPGPGNMLLSMDIVKNKIVAGSKDRRLHIWQMPEQVLTLLAERT